MTSLTTFFLSRIIGKKITGSDGKSVGIIKDVLIDASPVNHTDAADKPMVIGFMVKLKKDIRYFSIQNFQITKINTTLKVSCTNPVELSQESINNSLFLAESVLDQQIVDLNGRKLVRVNDVRLVFLPMGTYAVAVDIGIEGLLRRIGISRPIKNILSLFNITIPAKFILWDDVQAIDNKNLNIKLSKSYTKLQMLHPSDLADIIEDLGKKSSAEIFSALDEEKAADVLEELETHAQIHIIESLPIEKIADVLEKMPADEVADILDELESEKAEKLLEEMETESSQEVRDLLEYADNSVGSLMTTDFLSFKLNTTVAEVITELRAKKPESVELYNLFVTESNDKLIGTFTLRDLVVSEPFVSVQEIMKEEPISLLDDQKVDDIAEIMEKYNLLAIPVIDKEEILQGMVVIDDVVEDLIHKRKTAK
jgi:CBS domain-containing protein/sporulation protein YlmC with PRC-barrel domain